jgi:hypothetical protein
VRQVLTKNSPGLFLISEHGYSVAQRGSGPFNGIESVEVMLMVALQSL